MLHKVPLSRLKREIVDLIEKVEIPGDVKAQLAYLQAKDKDGGWDNKSNTVNVQFNLSQNVAIKFPSHLLPLHLAMPLTLDTPKILRNQPVLMQFQI